MLAPRHRRESERLEALRRYGILDTPPEEEFDDLVRLTATICGTPVAAVNLVDGHRQWFKAAVGVKVRETSLESSFSAHAILQEGVVEVADATLDPRFRANPLVVDEPYVRFFAAAPLLTPEGLPIGTLCVMDHQPRRLTEAQRDALGVLSRQVMAQFELRLQLEEAAAHAAQIEEILETAEVATWRWDIRRDRVRANRLLQFFFGLSDEEAAGGAVASYLRPMHPDDRERVAEALRRSVDAGAAYEVEYRVTGADGQERWVLARGRGEFGPDGKVDTLAGILVDITARRRAEIQRRERAERLRLLAESAADLLEIRDPHAMMAALFERVRESIGLDAFIAFSVDASGTKLRADAYAGVPDEIVAEIGEFDFGQAICGASAALRQPIVVTEAQSSDDPRHLFVKRAGMRAYACFPLLAGERLLGTLSFATHRRDSFDALDLEFLGTVAHYVAMAKERLRVEAERERLLGELSVEQERMRTLFDLTPAFIAVVRGRDMVFEFANDAYYQLVGHRPIVGRTVVEALPEVQGQGFIELLTRVYETGQPYVGRGISVILQRSPDGPMTEHYLDLTYQALRETDGSISGILAHGVDVTEQVHAERALAAERAQFQALLDEVPEHIVTIRGPELVYEFANRRFMDFVRRSDVVGRRLTDVWPVPDEHVDLLRRICETGETFAGHEEPVPSPVDPNSVDYFDFAFRPMRDSLGNTTGVFVHSLDVTEKVLARRELAESEERFRTVFEGAPDDAILLMDPSRTLLAWNPAAERVCGWTAAEAVGQSGDIIFTSEDRTEGVPDHEAEHAVVHGKTVDERWHLRKDGSRFWGSGTMNALRNPDGSLYGFLKVFRDATERHEMERRVRELNDDLEARVAQRTAELVAKNEELEGFTYSVSHDMRTPLRGIVANARLVLEEEGERVSPSGRARLERLEIASLRMAQLVDDLLEYARLGRRELRVESVDLSALANQTAAAVRGEHRDSECLFAVEPNLVAECDPRIVGMALQNLFDNACKYRKPETPAIIRFGVQEIEGESVFYVADNGIGFDMAYVGKLFQPFERLHREEYAGTGIGLANVRRAVERHGGRVWAEGKLGRGATFYFTLRG
jgi:PAS domain S-box-containing protein